MSSRVSARAKPRKTSSETAGKTLEQILQGEDVDSLLASITPLERSILEEIVGEIRVSGSSAELESLWKFDYVRKPPEIAAFLDDPYWLGNVTHPTEENSGLWPTWRSILLRDFDLDSRIHNLVITGSLGIGKTWVMVLILLYRLTLASLLRNPQNFVGLARGSRIIYVLMSVTRAQVADTAFGDAMNMMSASPYFTEVLGFDPDSKYSSGVINLGANIQLNSGSKSQHIVGRNTLGAGMDEGNFRLEANPDAKAFKLFGEVRTRIKNRFQKNSGFLPAISVIASSAKDESSFTEQVMAEIRKAASPKTETIYSYAVYELKNAERWHELGADPHLIASHANRYANRWFKVSYGLKNVPPAILQGVYDSKGNPIEDGVHEPAPDGTKTVLVPMDYRSEYERNLTSSLQSLSGISTGGSYKLLSSTIDLEYCIEAGREAGIVNPSKVLEIPVTEEDDRELWDYLIHKNFLARNGGKYVPKFHPNALRYAHMDLATRNMCGLSICHMVGWRDIEGIVERKSGRVFADQRLIVQYDFILTIVAGKDKPISFEKLQKFFIWLRDWCNYRFGMITADTFQSFMTLQMLETRKFKTGSLSLDRTKAPYYAWRAGIEERRILAYQQDQMVKEAEQLIDGPQKVDHPTAGAVTSKDTCLVGNTKIRLANGKTCEVDKFHLLPEEERYVFAISPNGRPVIAKAANPRLTDWTTDIYKMRTSKGAELFCTGNHRIMLWDGSFKQMRDLKKGDRLMPFARAITSDVDYRTGLVAGTMPEFDGGNSFETAKNLKAAVIESRNECDLIKNLTMGMVEINRKKTAKRFKRRPEVWDDHFENAPSYIVTVWSLRRVKLMSPVPVYDITVPSCGNFALAAGFYVHNCDGAAGAYYNCISDGDQAGTQVDPNSQPVHGNDDFVVSYAEKPPVEIVVPPYRRQVRRYQS